MRLQDSSKQGRIARILLVLSSTTALAACGALGGSSSLPVAMANPAITNGPQADYPIIVGEPYSVGDTLYTPEDVLNYDEVGYLAAGTGMGITGGHHTLPYPSYVEVTSLESGKTILVRLEERGPMNSAHLISLSPAAMAQLEASADEPVRVRRVNPPEEQRAMLRADQSAPMRMDTPEGLVQVLRRRLPPEGSVSLATVAPPAQELPQLAEVEPQVETPQVERPQAAPQPARAANDGVFETDSFDEAFARVESTPARAEPRRPAPPPPPPPAQISDGFVVQAAAFSTVERAQRVANAINGRIEQSGRYYRVRTGPFATRAQAEASLANVRAAGYSDARIFSDG